MTTRNGAPEAIGSPDRQEQTPRPPREEAFQAPETTAGSAMESFTETPPAVSSWDKPSEQNDGWHTPSTNPPQHETHLASDSGESAPKPELVQVETRSDTEDDRGNK